MAQILVFAGNNTHSDPDKDRSGSWKRGYCVIVFPDSHTWGAKEGLPKFVKIKVPLIGAARVRKYIDPEMSDTETDDFGRPIIHRRRLWTIRWNDLPLAARQKLLSEGELIIKATAAYTGSFDYTWAQVKVFFRNLKTGTDETEDL